MAKKNYDVVFKVLLIGDSGVGKTCILHRYTDDSYDENLLATIGIDFKVKALEMRDKRICLQIWDTAGQERFHTITNSYYRGASGIVLVYDITSEKSFANIATWLTNINKHASSNVIKILVGNKLDQADNRVISTERGQTLAEQLEVCFFETSALDGSNVRQMFLAVIGEMLDSYLENEESAGGWKHRERGGQNGTCDCHQEHNSASRVACNRTHATRSSSSCLLLQGSSSSDNDNGFRQAFDRCSSAAGGGNCFQ